MRRFLIPPALVAAALLYALVDPEAGIRACSRLRADLAQTRERIAVVEAEVAALRARAQELRDDPLAIEAAIREDLELAKPGETVVKLRRPAPEGRDFLDASSRSGDAPAP